MGLPTGKQINQNAEALEAGTYQATLKSIDLDISTEFQSDLRFQSAVMTWDIEGEPFVERFIKVSLNDKSKFYNRISALIGRDIGDEDDSLEWFVSDKAETNHTVDLYKKIKETDEFDKYGEENDGIVGHVDDLKAYGQSVIGKTCLLALKVNAAGYNRADAKAATALPRSRRVKPVATADAGDQAP